MQRLQDSAEMEGLLQRGVLEMASSPEVIDAASAVAASALTCGLVMPISAIDGCGQEHWAEVKAIVKDAVEGIEQPKFLARLVSDADEVGVIQKRIVQGIYTSDIVVCDVSGKNPNVMFELGLRLAFDKPTVIIKDDKTEYSFDTNVIEHLTYPRDLRFSRIVEFKLQLASKIVATYNAAKNDPQHSTFLRSFGTFNVARLEQRDATPEQVILDVLGDLQREVAGIRTSMKKSSTGLWHGIVANAALAETRGSVSAYKSTANERNALANQIIILQDQLASARGASDEDLRLIRERIAANQAALRELEEESRNS